MKLLFLEGRTERKVSFCTLTQTYTKNPKQRKQFGSESLRLFLFS